MSHDLGLIICYLFGDDKEREEARLALSDRLEEEGHGKASYLRHGGAQVWVPPGSWEIREIHLMQAATLEAAAESFRRRFNTPLEMAAWLEGYQQGHDFPVGFYRTEAECVAAIRGEWEDLHLDRDNNIGDDFVYDDADDGVMFYGPDPDEDDEGSQVLEFDEGGCPVDPTEEKGDAA